MLDFVMSKIAMMIAAIVILTSVLGFFYFQREEAKDLELENIAEKFTDAVNNINSLQGETVVNVTFDEGKEGIYVRPNVNGNNYEILMSRSNIIITQEKRRASDNFITPVHLWEPENKAYNQTQIEQKDDDNKKLEFVSGQDFKIERKFLEISGENEYMTFVYI